jgi:hypothetical protein
MQSGAAGIFAIATASPPSEYVLAVKRIIRRAKKSKNPRDLQQVLLLIAELKEVSGTTSAGK